MKNILSVLILLMILSAGSITGIARQSSSGPPPPPPPPAPDYAPRLWKEFSSAEGRFKVLLPGTPTASEQKEATQLGELVVHSFHYEGVTAYDLMYVEFPANINVEDPAVFKKSYEDMRNGMLSNISQANPRIVKETDFSLDNCPGKFLHLDLGAYGTIRLKFIAVKNRVYSISVASRKAQQGVMGSDNDYEEIAMTFLNSFQIVKQ